MSTYTMRPRLAVTMGDPAGIGTEVILKALADPHLQRKNEITIVGNRDLIVENYKRLSLATKGLPLANLEDLSILDVPLNNKIKSDIIIGKGSNASGAASFAYMETAIACTLNGKFDGIVTAPIAKSAWKSAGYDYPGQTELLAEKAGINKFGMLFVAQSPHSNWILRCLLATTHIPLNQVPQVLTPDLMNEKLDLLVECIENDFRIKNSRIVIAGLNPHSGEGGLLGNEERDWLIPWLEEQRQQRPHLQLLGPTPPDTMWVEPGKAWYDRNQESKTAHGYITLYHDQGLIPLKLMAFDRAVNTTIGLPFIRTSPDHGTAFDIAGQGIADATSMKAAIQLAFELI